MIAAEGVGWCTHEVLLDYQHYSADVILRELLPPEVEVPTSFETVGHIARLTLREEHLPYKSIIGEVLLDKNPHLRTVVNKVGEIENEFRVSDMEVLAGEPNFETEVVQYKARFRLDFSKVFWNSRLEAEHRRVVESFHPSEVVVDVMAGIGPFALPAAQKGCRVLANDLNPDSVHYLRINCRLNKVQNKVEVYNMDGREFIRRVSRKQDSDFGQTEGQAPGQPSSQNSQLQGPCIEKKAGGAVDYGGDGATIGRTQNTSLPDTHRPRTLQPGNDVGPFGSPTSHPAIAPLRYHHAVMNLPATAIQFVDAFRGSFDRATWEGPLPMVHCYTFKKATESEEDIIRKLESYLGGPLEEPAHIHCVRDVSPNKVQLCVSFRVPSSVGFWEEGPSDGCGEDEGVEEMRNSKKQRLGVGTTH